MEKQKQLFLESEPDLLAPYLVKYGDRKLDVNESMKVFDLCLKDFEADYLDLLNDLQRNFDEVNCLIFILLKLKHLQTFLYIFFQLVLEEQDFKRFLNKFQDKLDDFEYENFIKDG